MKNASIIFVTQKVKGRSSRRHDLLLPRWPYVTFTMLINVLLIKSSPTMWWWRLLVFAESARRRHLFLLSLGNPYSDYFQMFAVCILALGNLPGHFFFRFSVQLCFTKSKMAAKNLWRTLEADPLHLFVSCLV